MEARTRSEGRSLPGYGIQEESKKTPNGFRGKRNPGREGQGREEVQKSRLREENEAWAEQHLPGENHYVVTAVRFHLRKAGQPETADNVREGLRERGWLKEQRS